MRRDNAKATSVRLLFFIRVNQEDKVLEEPLDHRENLVQLGHKDRKDLQDLRVTVVNEGREESRGLQDNLEHLDHLENAEDQGHQVHLENRVSLDLLVKLDL